MLFLSLKEGVFECQIPSRVIIDQTNIEWFISLSILSRVPPMEYTQPRVHKSISCCRKWKYLKFHVFLNLLNEGFNIFLLCTTWTDRHTQIICEYINRNRRESKIFLMTVSGNQQFSDTNCLHSLSEYSESMCLISTIKL